MQFRETESAQKLRGGYYTPLDLAVFISKWIVNNKAKHILEPSSGDGIFFEAISMVSKSKIKIKAFEIEPEEAAKARNRATHLKNVSVDIVASDFLGWALRNIDRGTLFDAAVGNPPFIRYQYLPEEAQCLAEKIFAIHGLPFTKHTNAWVPFVIAALSLLKPGGLLGMVLPAEILHVMHAQSLRYFLGNNCKRMVLFDPKDLWFEKTLQGAVILLAEKKSRPDESCQGLGIIQTIGQSFLDKRPEEYFENCTYLNGKTVEGKWTRALLSQGEVELYEHSCSKENVREFAQIAEVDVGLVTGANKFFLVPDKIVKKYRLESWAYPMFGRSEHCPGVIYNMKQHRENAQYGLPSNFLWFNVASDAQLPKNARAYVAEGEKVRLHTRYKCRIRRPWYKVPSVYATRIGMLKRAHEMPRLIYNEIGAYTTDTAYRIRTKGIPAKKIVRCFVNSLTALCAELEGRHYGGGVLELVPSEIERLMIPLPTNVRNGIVTLDRMIRKNNAEDVLEYQDRTILNELRLSKAELDILRNAWRRLSRRRQRHSLS
jgi:adenine-specific DNA-methyltransferase